ncbi:hypothetical protein [Ferruginivarius sediminum]|uniref:Uncharacterized protein n=1 Tax=Ferruginivarius sediminum TaxID=2661937 RepID=A0A369TE49_9PROT|nr:hypothetical protein [Ferruginivarius sediminum]RDD61206.1 hypothetical protein DRB17_14060 [Ferruginivarius sediminum]
MIDRPRAEGSALACESLDPNIPCKCRDAVVRSYREMLASGASHTDAHMVAARVYSYHHPGYPADKVNRLIARLIEPGVLH